MASLNGPHVVNVAAAEKGEVIRLIGWTPLGTNLQHSPVPDVQLPLEPQELSVVVVQTLVANGSHCSHQARQNSVETASGAGLTLAAENGTVV